METSPFKILIISIIFAITLTIGFNTLNYTLESSEVSKAERSLSNLEFAMDAVSYGSMASQRAEITLLGNSKIIFYNEVIDEKPEDEDGDPIEVRGRIDVIHPQGNKIIYIPMPINYIIDDSDDPGNLTLTKDGDETKLTLKCSSTCYETHFNAGNYKLIIKKRSAEKLCIIVEGKEKCSNSKTYYYEVSLQ